MNLKKFAIFLLVVTNVCYAEEDSEQKTHSRKRRYIIFPTGSSLQLVYDQIIPIIDYTNIFIFGLTTALAWQLPDKPHYPDKKIKLDRIDVEEAEPASAVNQRFNSNITYDLKSELSSNFVDVEDKNAKLSSDYSDYYAQARQQNYYPMDEFEFNNGQGSSPYYRPWAKNSNWNEKYQYPTSSILSTNYHQTPKTEPYKKHYIYPAVYKRSIRNAQLSHEDKFYLNHHRTTRQDLYRSIEKYLYAHGKNGTECVRKALCETGQKRHETEPGTFVGEIMRVIFSLPYASEAEIKSQNLRHYDEAFQMEAHHNCTELFPLCEESVWSADFIF